MRIEFEMDGGLAYIPGLARPVTIELDKMPEPEAREIRDLIVATRFFDRPARAGDSTRPPGADQRSYTVTVTSGAERHQLTLTEPIGDEELRRLVRLLEIQARKVRRLGMPGQSP
jgi:Emfourin